MIETRDFYPKINRQNKKEETKYVTLNTINMCQ